jgi:hypothetical protein
MAKVITTITDKQSGKVEVRNKEIIPRPVLNTHATLGVWSASGQSLPVAQPKKKFVLLDKDEKTVATLIDRFQAEKWVAENKKGSVRFIEAESTAAVID